MDNKEIKAYKIFFTASIFLGFVSMFFGIIYYEKTFINGMFLVFVAIIPSLLYFLFINKKYKEVYNSTLVIYPLMQSVFSIGFLIVSLILFVNCYFSSVESNMITRKIIHAGKQGGRGKQSYGIIKYKGIEKKILFNKDVIIKKSAYIKMKVSKGGLGFYIIKNKQIVN
ncbi:conserved membrane protein of unknown function [Tenacibaculum sp. 190524A02b]|uniref:hypothetical protein n=1 Tax=Tenacibaculum vairaonense TaxID=3137860 RepID=UPI0032B1551E